ncbi:MAG: hypothetical protein HYR84_06880 [Planctomycetes bacterium]|nr:hypothetical protein [Planctomycetota bacterium]
MFERWGRFWEIIFGYDVQRNGWWCELRDITDCPASVIVLIAFRPDETGVLSVSQHRDGLLPEIVEWFTAQADNAVIPVISS